MGIIERKEKEKEKMRNRIIKASIKLFVEEGYENTSMRKIAKIIQYSPTTIYLYFKNKTELFYHVHEHLFENLYNELSSKKDFQTPLDHLHFISKTYIYFATNNQESYRLMFVIKTPSVDIKNENEWNFGMKCLRLIEDTVSKFYDSINENKYSVDSLAFSFISYLHGVSSLAIQQRLSVEYNTKIDELISDSISLFFNKFNI